MRCVPCLALCGMLCLPCAMWCALHAFPHVPRLCHMSHVRQPHVLWSSSESIQGAWQAECQVWLQESMDPQQGNARYSLTCSLCLEQVESTRGTYATPLLKKNALGWLPPASASISGSLTKLMVCLHGMVCPHIHQLDRAPCACTPCHKQTLPRRHNVSGAQQTPRGYPMRGSHGPFVLCSFGAGGNPKRRAQRRLHHRDCAAVPRAQQAGGP